MTDSAFTLVYLSAQPTLSEYARKLTRNRERAEDLLQDANVRIWEKRALYVEGNFLSWCKTVMRNYYLTQVAIEARMRFTDKQFATGNTELQDSEGDSSNEHLHAKYLSEPPNQEDYWLENRIHEAIASLPSHTALLIQKKLEGLTYAEIARPLGIKANNAKQRYHNDIRTLRKLLLELGLVDSLTLPE